MKRLRTIFLTLVLAACGGTLMAQKADTTGTVGAQAAGAAKPQPKDTSEVHLQAVDIAASKIVRKADRFVVTVENNPVAVGKTAFEMLSSAPAVWVGQNDISVNGRGGTTVMIDERVLHMSFDELKSYLSNIKAEDIRTIEIIPIAGAEYDAASSGGIIKITLKRQRNDGIDGSVSLKLTRETDKEGYGIFPSANLNYKTGKLGLYSTFSFRRDGGTGTFSSRTLYDNLPDTVTASTTGTSKFLSGNVRAGAIYDLTPKHSIGAEYYWNGNSEKAVIESTSSLIRPATRTDNVSRYNNHSRGMNMGVTANYLWKIDTLGSQFKVIGGWTVRPNSGQNEYRNSFSTWQTADPANVITGDSLYRNDPASRYNLYRISADLDYKLGAKQSIKTGVKYNYTLTTASQDYSGFTPPDAWTPLQRFNYENHYSERIAAVYGIYNGQFGRVGLTAGLRGEYTDTRPRTTQTIDGQTSVTGAQREYFNLFPNVNLSYGFDKNGNNSLVANYARSISRPPFWAIDPFRRKISEYQYQEGNPDLKPSLTDDISLTFIYHKKYSLTAGTFINNDAIMQLSYIDNNDPAVTVLRSANMERYVSWYISLQAPMTLTKWWELTLNATGLQKSSTNDGSTRRAASASVNATSTAPLPGKVIFETRGYLMTPGLWGTTEIGWWGGLNASLKKNFLNNKLTAAVGADNILERASRQRLVFHGSTFATRSTSRWAFFTVWGSVRYSFKAGKGASTKRVDTSDDQSSRMEGKQQ